MYKNKSGLILENKVGNYKKGLCIIKKVTI